MIPALAFVVLAAPPVAELTTLVEDFLAGASRDDVASTSGSGRTT